MKCLTLPLLFLSVGCGRPESPPATIVFDPGMDLLSLHYDHAPDKDDGQSAAADRTLLQSVFDADWISGHVVAVSGTYGENAEGFNPVSDAVMDTVWNDTGGWLPAHANRDFVVVALADRWIQALLAGGNVWVKEGGQSDITAEVVRRIRDRVPRIETGSRIHVVQHSDWNEEQTTDTDLHFVKRETDYIRIRDANAYLNVLGGDTTFVHAAEMHPTFARFWRAAFDYYPPTERLDFSDTGELMHILGLGEVGIDEFRTRFLVNY